MSSRDTILGRLRAAQIPSFAGVPAQERRVMVPMDGKSLCTEFTQQARVLSAAVIRAQDDRAALDYVLDQIGDDRAILAWDYPHIPLEGLADALQESGIRVADTLDSGVRVGITGVDAALAATGSILVSASPGRPRSVSLLPYVHIAVIREAQILPHFEAWIAQQSTDLDAFRHTGTHVIITGASRTADIGMELVLGAHGPAQLHLLLLP